MSVLIETSLGNLVIDLFVDQVPRNTKNFLKLCKVKYYNYCVFHSVQKGFAVQTGDPTLTGEGGQSIEGILKGAAYKYLPHEIVPTLKHKHAGIVCMAPLGGGGTDLESGRQLVNGSQFFITTGDNLSYLDGKYTIIGEVGEGHDVLKQIDAAYVDDTMRPLKDIRVKHTIVLDDPFDDPPGLQVHDASPPPTDAQLKTGRLDAEEELEEDVDEEARAKRIQDAEARAQALTLEMVGDLPFAEVKPPENVIFVCKLNPITRDEDLELIFSRFGKIHSCEVIRDRKTGESLCYAFVEFDEKESAEEAYFKMDNVLIDDRRIHVDLSQSVSRLHGVWNAKRTGQRIILPDGLEHRAKKDSFGKNDAYDMVFKHERERLDEKYGASSSQSRDAMRKPDRYRNNHQRRSRSPPRPRRDDRSSPRSRREDRSPPRRPRGSEDHRSSNYNHYREREEDDKGNQRREDTRRR